MPTSPLAATLPQLQDKGGPRRASGARSRAHHKSTGFAVADKLRVIHLPNARAERFDLRGCWLVVILPGGMDAGADHAGLITKYTPQKSKGRWPRLSARTRGYQVTKLDQALD